MEATVTAHTRTFELELVENVDAGGEYAEKGVFGDRVFGEIKQTEECYYVVHDRATLFGFGGPSDDIDPGTEERPCGSADGGFTVTESVPDDEFPLGDGEYAWVERTHGRAVGGGAILFEDGGINETTHDGIGVARTGENGGEGVFCDGHVEEGSASDFAVGC